MNDIKNLTISTRHLEMLPDSIFSNIQVTHIQAKAFDFDDEIDFTVENQIKYELDESIKTQLNEIFEICNFNQSASIIRAFSTDLRQQFNRWGIKELSPDIKYLSNLEYLDLSNNRLTNLPKEIGYLKNLKILRLSNNNLKYIPFSIKRLKNLECLDLSHNPILRIPREIIGIKSLIKAENYRISKQKQITRLMITRNFTPIDDLRPKMKQKGIYLDRKIRINFFSKDQYVIAAILDK